jgi:phosphoribosyl-ATP pyrophosphohydrolase
MKIIEQLTQILFDRKQESAEKSYVAKLYSKGTDAILKKIGEETAEYIMAVKDNDNGKIIYEAADVIFHLYVSLVNRGIKPEKIYQELERRFGISGLDEKRNRGKK